MSRIAQQVEAILRQDPRARNSDNVLIVHLLQLQGAHLTKEQIEVILSISFESVTRYRRKIQEEGRYLPDKKISEARALKSKIMLANAVQRKAEEVFNYTTERVAPLRPSGKPTKNTDIEDYINPEAPPEAQQALRETMEWLKAPVRKKS